MKPPPLTKLPIFEPLKYYKENYPINDDITEEIKFEEEEKIIKNIYITKKDNLKNNSLFENKKLIFLVHKRAHSDDINDDSQYSLKKSTKHKKHDRNEKDNIITKIQIHYRNFLIEFINEVTQKIILEDCYRSKKFDKLMHLKEYLFNKIDRHFKYNIKKETMKLVESLKLKEIISPSASLCKKYNFENINQSVMEKIESLNNPILNKILNNKYLYLFDIYYNSERKVNLKEGEYNINLELNHSIKLFGDLIEKQSDDEKYISNLKKFAVLNFSKINQKYEEKLRKIAAI